MLAGGRRTSLPLERMTPIRIRGKKEQKARLQALRNKQLQQAAADEAGGMSPTSDSDLPERSGLEYLPVEIIESIFLYSLEFNLPRASLKLGRALSSTHIKNSVLRVVVKNPYEQNRLGRQPGEIGEIQSALLRCRWFDHSMFARVLNEVRVNALAAFFQAPQLVLSNKQPMEISQQALLGPGCPILDTSTATIASFLQNLQEQSNEHGERIWKWVADSGRGFSLFLTKYPGRIVLVSYSSQNGSDRIDYQLMCEFELACGCQIPSKVLHGPWTRTKIEFLDALMNARASLGWESSSNGEEAERSLKEAIVHTNLPLLNVLSQTSHHLNASMKDGDPECDSKIQLTQEHLRLAIFEGGCKKAVVQTILRSRRCGSLRLDAPDIVEWAVDKKAAGDSRGDWLLLEVDRWETERIVAMTDDT
ncbi:MAG: hypothetical protein Q9220_007079 [cf. Caloplaca sp. 1 TL-2023]